MRDDAIQSFRCSNTLEHHIDTHGSSSGLGIRYNVDFEIIEYSFVYDPFYDDILKMASDKELIKLLRESNNVVQETHMKLVVVK